MWPIDLLLIESIRVAYKVDNWNGDQPVDDSDQEDEYDTAETSSADEEAATGRRLAR